MTKPGEFAPRLPLEGNIDLTYRCNNDCRHCWVRLEESSPEKSNELTFNEIRIMAEEARALGCQRWAISGGEPMLRPDFPEIFDVLTRKAVTFALNTNGTLITPAIAKLLKRKGTTMVALYGATHESHDRITRNPGSFEAFLQGVARLKEAGADFMIQVIPMRSNWHQFRKMIRLAESLAPSHRIGSAWLFYSAGGSQGKNQEIEAERLPPEVVLSLDPPQPGYEPLFKEESCLRLPLGVVNRDDRIFRPCIASGRDFHVDAYGGMSFCSFIRDPSLRYNLRQGTVKEAWEQFIPDIADRVRGGAEYLENCGSCQRRRGCRWCAVYAYLEHRRHSAPISYLCATAEASVRYKSDWKKNHRRFFEIAGITLQVDSDLPIMESTFLPNIKIFQKQEPGPDLIRLSLHFQLPDLKDKNLGREVYRRPPWVISKQGKSWIYAARDPGSPEIPIHRIAVFSEDHGRAQIYCRTSDLFLKGGLPGVTLFPSDQILLARILADRNAFSIHAAGLAIGENGFLFIGRSESGKSTIATLLEADGELLCDETIIVRRWPQGYRIHGTWSHGDVPRVSNRDVPLRALLFIEKAEENRLELLNDKRNIIGRLLPRLFKPLITADWWEKTLTTVEGLLESIPAYVLYFQKSPRIRSDFREWFPAGKPPAPCRQPRKE